MVANAALPASGKLDDFSSEEVQRAIRVNFESPILMARALAPKLVKKGEGHLVFISSLSGKVGSPRAALYGATKFGLRGFAFGLREDLHETGVGVSIVSPGFVRGAGMWADADVDPPPMIGTTTPAKVAKAVARAIERNRNEITVAPRRQRFAGGVRLPPPGAGRPHAAARWRRADRLRARRRAVRQAVKYSVRLRVKERTRGAPRDASNKSRDRRGHAEARVGVGRLRLAARRVERARRDPECLRWCAHLHRRGRRALRDRYEQRQRLGLGAPPRAGTALRSTSTSPSRRPAARPDGNYPLIIVGHGYGGSKIGFGRPVDIDGCAFTSRGYAVFSMTDRGFHQSCGSASVGLRRLARRATTATST